MTALGGAAALVLTLAGCAGGGADGADDKALTAARERVERGIQAVAAADGGTTGYATEKDTGTSRSGRCAEVRTEPTSVAPDRYEVTAGTFTEDEHCAVGHYFTVDGDIVYVDTDTVQDGAACFEATWAHVDPAVLDEFMGGMQQEVDPEPATRLMDAATEVADESTLDLTVDLSVDALLDAGVEPADPDAFQDATGTGTFTFTDDGALTEIAYTITKDDVSATTRQYFRATGEPQHIVLPTGHCLGAEAPPLTTVDDLRAFVGWDDPAA
ncbi:hypothetical protein Cch01nite_22850 [Cellulomonas chitinilytica]|uniref:Uncharacterized protein n=1 Tax=Cellulomonas chitinilytica TaxID=398759 RepID=A0A919U1N3_9CELL|nr:hypothetical protein [Cellulomonas chitinilytica]GIG21561.1 hypothetical protein Cch01nite_22850 [Cellulomonas chitinilytica]